MPKQMHSCCFLYSPTVKNPKWFSSLSYNKENQTIFTLEELELEHYCLKNVTFFSSSTLLQFTPSVVYVDSICNGELSYWLTNRVPFSLSCCHGTDSSSKCGVMVCIVPLACLYPSFYLSVRFSICWPFWSFFLLRPVQLPSICQYLHSLLVSVPITLHSSPFSCQ